MVQDGSITISILADDSQWTRTINHLAQKSGKSIAKGINAHTQPLGRITGESNEFQKSLAASNARVIAFGASTGVIFAMKSAFQQLVHATIDVEKEMIEVNSIFRLSSQQLKSFTNDLFSLASNYGLAFNEATKAAVEFARQGNTVEETLKRTAAALALTRISGIGVEESVTSLTSILNTFQKEGLEAMDVVNRMTAVDQNFAISAGGMAEALSRVSSSASDANVSLNETMAIIAAAKQITGRSASVIGNGLKTMFTRLQRPEVIDDLEAVGVKARDTEGKIRPMLDIFRQLSSTYDGLASSQKSFVAETVGGVYQINVLKGIMKGLGSEINLVDNAMEVAANSTDFVNSRMEVLNETISSQLIRTANNLKLAFYNIGTSLISGPLRTGLGNFDALARGVGKYTDSKTAKEGSGGEKVIANTAQGLLKGIANFASGPGLQFVMTTLLKLFERLDSFIVQSAKDLAGINVEEKQRQALNQGISEWLATQKGLLGEILNGQVSINQAVEKYLDDMKGAVSTANNLKSITEAIGSRANPQVTFSAQAPRAASGYIPSLEIAEARKGGYQAGRVLGTTVDNGTQRLNVIANSSETITRVVKEGNNYDFINPPAGSPAGNLHRRESIKQTGIDPYELPKMQMKARGAIPNLALSPDMVKTIMDIGIEPKDVVEKARLTRLENFTSLPEDLVGNFVSRYRYDKPSLMAALVAMTKKGANMPLNNGPAMAKFLSGFMLNPLAKEKGLFKDMTSAGISTFTESLTGKESQSPQAALAKLAKITHLRPDDVQKVLDLHSKSFPFIAGYESPHDLSVAKDRPDQVSHLDFPISTDTNEMRKFKINTPLYGFKGDIVAQMRKIEAMILAEAESSEPFTPGEIGTTRGVFFDKKLRGMAQKEGIPVGEPGSALDIYGPVKSIIAKTNIKEPVAGMELKASATGATDSGNMAEKLFRVLAGEPGTGGRKPALKGPTAYVPKLTNVQKFNGDAGGIGIIDADKYGQEGATDAAFASIIYAAVASGKPLRIHYGPMTMGKTTAAEHIVNKAGGLGGLGGDYITDIKQIDSERFKQFIINKTDRKNLDTGVFGLALSSASDVRGFYSPYTEYRAKHEEMIKRLQTRNRGQEGKNAEAIAKKYDEPAWQEYEANMSHLGKKLGSDRFGIFNPDNPTAARGLVPNLSIKDSYAKLKSLQDNQTLSNLVATQARTFVKSVGSIKKNGFDEEYLIAALAQKAKGEDVSDGTMKLLRSTMGISDSMFEVLCQGFEKQLDLPVLKDHVKHGEFNAGGQIPNLYNAISDALDRENDATGGNAVLSSHPLLRTAQNPMGFAAIDKRSQANAGEAIRQHMSAGQSISQVQMAHTAKGKIPNLAVDSPYDEPFNTAGANGTFSSFGMLNSLLLSIVGAVRNEFQSKAVDKSVANGDGYFTRKLNEFKSLGSSFAALDKEGAQAAAKLRLLSEEFAQAREKLVNEEDVRLSRLAGGKKFSGKSSTRLKDIDEEAKEVIGKIRPRADIYLKAQQEFTTRSSKVGLGVATLASFGGGLATQIANNSNASLGAAVEEFSNGATQAGQILLTFPNKFGWVGALTLAGASAVSAIDVWRKGTAQAARTFELNHARLETMNSQLDSLAVSINQYDTIITDASVSLQAIESTQREYRETLAQLRDSSKEGKATSVLIESLPNSGSQIKALMDEKRKNVKDENFDQSLFAVRKYADKRKFIGSEFMYGVKPLAYGNDSEKRQVQTLVRGLAGSSIAEMSSGLKSIAMSASSSAELTKTIADAIDNANPEISESAQKLKTGLDNLGDFLGTEAFDNIKKAIVNQLQSEKESNTPERQEKLNALKRRTGDRQEDLQSSINYARLQQRIFVNSGALNANNQINRRDVANQGILNNDLVTGPNSFAKRQAEAGVYRLKYGERTVKEYETASETGRVQAETGYKLTQARNDASRVLVGALTQNFDEKIKNPELYKEAGKAGGGLPTLGLSSVDLISKLNKGITEVFKNQDISKFISKSGQVDTEGIIKAIADSSGARPEEKDGVIRYLQAEAGQFDIQRATLELNKQMVSLTQDGNNELAKLQISLQGLYRELNFKELAGYMGGIKNLLDRNSRRTLQRNLVRGAFLMEHGRTAEAKASGAATYLEALKSMGQPLDPNKNTNLSRSIKQAYIVGSSNFAEVQREMGARVGNSPILANTIGGQGLKELGGKGGIDTAIAGFLSAFPIENGKISKDSIKNIDDTSNLFNISLAASTKALNDFAINVNASAVKMIEAQQAANALRVKNEKANEDDAKDFGKKTATEPRETPTQGPDKGLGKYGAANGARTNYGLIGGAFTTAGIAGYFLLKKRNQRKETEALEAELARRTSPSTPQESYNLARQKSLIKYPYARKESILKLRPREESLIERPTDTVLSETISPTPTNAAEKSEQFKRDSAMRQRQKNIRNALSRKQRQESIEFNTKLFNPKILTERDITFAQNANKNLPTNPSEEAIYNENIGRASEVSSKGTPTRLARRASERISSIRERVSYEKPEYSAFKSGGGKKALASTLVVLGSLLAFNKLKGADLSNQEAPTDNETPAPKVSITPFDAAKTGIDTVTNALLLKNKSKLPKLGDFKKGGALALTGLFADKVEDALGGYTGKGAGAAINIGAATKFFGKSGGAGAAIGIGSELLRNNFTEKKYGYGAGVSQGFAGAVGSGALFGPAGAVINGAAYLGSEALQVREQTTDELKRGKFADSDNVSLDAYDVNGTTEDNVKDRSDLLIKRLTGRTNELKNRKVQDEEDFSGFYGQISRPFSPRQFGEKEEKELNKTTFQKARLSQAVASGSTKEMIKVLQDIQNELIKQSRDMIKPEDKSDSSKTGTINSQINVDISVKDADRIPSEINDGIIEPLRQQLAELQLRVNELMNARSPMPAKVG